MKLCERHQPKDAACPKCSSERNDLIGGGLVGIVTLLFFVAVYLSGGCPHSIFPPSKKPEGYEDLGFYVAPSRPRQMLELWPQIPRNDIPNQRMPSLGGR